MTLVSNNKGYKDNPSPHRILSLVARHKKNNELSKSHIQDAHSQVKKHVCKAKRMASSRVVKENDTVGELESVCWAGT